MVALVRPKFDRRIKRALELAALREERGVPPYRTHVEIVPVETGGYTFALRTQPALPVPPPTTTGTPTSVLQPLPRREQAPIETAEDVGPPPLRRVVLREASLAEALGRLFVWMNALAFYFVGTLWDYARRRNTDERRAVRQRRMSE